MPFRLLILPVCLAALAACEMPPPQTPPSTPPVSSPPAAVAPDLRYPEINGQAVPPPAGLDLAALEAFVAGGPTMEAFEARYPGILVVRPGTPTTMEYRMNYSRFFPDLDAQGRIVGGAFH